MCWRLRIDATTGESEESSSDDRGVDIDNTKRRKVSICRLSLCWRASCECDHGNPVLSNPSLPPRAGQNRRNRHICPLMMPPFPNIGPSARHGWKLFETHLQMENTPADLLQTPFRQSRSGLLPLRLRRQYGEIGYAEFSIRSILGFYCQDKMLRSSRSRAARSRTDWIQG